MLFSMDHDMSLSTLSHHSAIVQQHNQDYTTGKTQPKGSSDFSCCMAVSVS